MQKINNRKHLRVFINLSVRIIQEFCFFLLAATTTASATAAATATTTGRLTGKRKCGEGQPVSRKFVISRYGRYFQQIPNRAETGGVQSVPSKI